MVDDIKSILPSNWQYVILNISNFGKTPAKTEVKFKIALFTSDDVKLWVESLELLTFCTYSIRSTEKRTGERVKFKQRLVCHHNTRKSSNKKYEPSTKSHTKNTSCPSSLCITINTIRKKFRGELKNIPDAEMPCIIHYVITHNHIIKTHDYLRFNRVSDNVKDKLFKLYSLGHTPKTALDNIKADIRKSHENSEEILADRRFCPDYNYCYHIFRTEFKNSRPVDVKETDEKEFLQRIKQDSVEMEEKPDSVTSTNNPQKFKMEVPSETEKKCIKDVSSDATTIANISDSEAIEEGQEIICELSETLAEYLQHSPSEVLPALQDLLAKTKELKTIKSFVSSCTSFGSERQNRGVKRKNFNKENTNG